MNKSVFVPAVLLVLSVSVVAVSSVSQRDPTLASISNAEASGTKALYDWLQEQQFAVGTFDQPLTELSDDVKTLVIAAPTAQEITDEEVAALSQWVTAGGTLVYLSPSLALQPVMGKWLQLKMESTPPKPLTDIRGAAKVLMEGNVFTHVETLSLPSDYVLSSGRPDAVSVTADHSLWLVLIGSGAVVVAAQAALVQNNQLERGDNATFLANLTAKGLLVFDEFHHRPALTGHAARWTLLAFGLAAFLVTMGKRLGPVHPTSPHPSESTRSQVVALARLAETAQFDASLLQQARLQFRRWLWQTRGLDMTLSEADCLRRLQTVAALYTEAQVVFQSKALLRVTAAKARAIAFNAAKG